MTICFYDYFMVFIDNSIFFLSCCQLDVQSFWDFFPLKYEKKSCSTSFYMQKHQVIFNFECGLRAFVYMQINCLLKCANCYSIFVACKIFPNDLTDEYVCAHLKKRLPFPLALATVCLNIKAYRVLKHSISDNAFFYCAFSMSGSKYHAWIQCPTNMHMIIGSRV